MNVNLQRISQGVQQIVQAPELYRHRLIIIILPNKLNQPLLLKDWAEQNNFHYLNINLELSRLLMTIPKSHQPLKAFRLFNDEIIGQSAEQGLVLDYLDILFDPWLKIDPMRFLLDISRRHIVVARWSGCYEKGYLVHAEPGHPEYNQYQVQDGVVINLETTS